MKMTSQRIIYRAIILFLLLAFTGCAKTMVAANGSDNSELPNSQYIKEITVSGAQVKITTNKPLTYTSYKTGNPPKLYLDLAQTEPGDIKQINNPSELIEGINVSRQDFGSGYLSRIEISLRKDSEFSVIPNPNDKGILTVLLKDSSLPSQPLKEESTLAKNDLQDSQPVDTPVNKETTEKHEQQSSPISNTDSSSEEVKANTAKVSTENPAIDSRRLLKAINVNDNLLAIAINGGPATFTSFKLDKPERLVVDLFDTKNSIQSNSVLINKFGFSRARIGASPEKTRIVFDADNNHLPEYKIIRSDNGLDLVFSDPNSKPQTTESTIPQVSSKQPSGSDKGVIESIDFSAIDGISRVSIKTKCSVEKPLETAKGITLNINNCRIPRNLQRPLDTKSFAGPISSVTPYQVKVAGVMNTRILIKLREKVAFTERNDAGTYVLDIKNTEPRQAAAQIRDRAAIPPVKIEQELITMAKEPDVVTTDLSVSKPLKQQKRVYNGRKVTLEFSDADIRKIFQLLAEVSNLNFLISDDVSGTISIKLVNVPWDQALEVILDSKNLGMQRDGNIVQIKPKTKMQSQADEEAAAKKARERSMELRSEIFDVNYAAVADIATQFAALKTDRGVITTDTRTNKVIVKDISTALEEMRTLLKNLDTPEKQVMIEARIVEASTSFVRDIGVQWGIHYTDGSASLAGISKLDTGFGGQVTNAPTSGTSGPGAAVGMSFGKLASNIQLDMRLSAAVTADQIKIMSTPRVVTLNNKPAKISQGASIPYQTTSAEGTKTEFVEAALTLEVTPHITSDGSIGMKIKASNNSAGTGSPPPINKKEATTELLVKNGETTVIGGIYVDSDTESDKGVPFLQDIPLLGWLFKSNSKNKTKNELLIFITPKIVS